MAADIFIICAVLFYALFYACGVPCAFVVRIKCINDMTGGPFLE